MASLGVRLFTDEHISARLARALRSRGYDVESCHEVGRGGLGIPDEEQLAYAAQQGQAVFTFNRTDFLQLDATWKRAGQHHAGIIISAEITDFGELLRRIERHLNTHPPSIQDDTLLWLDSSPTR